MNTLPVYDEYIKLNLAPTRKLLEKRPNTNGLSSEGMNRHSVLFFSTLTRYSPRSSFHSSQTIPSNTFSSSSKSFFLSRKQTFYLRILQDLYQTTQSFESGDKDSVTKLYNHAQRCRLYGVRTDYHEKRKLLLNAMSFLAESTR